VLRAWFLGVFFWAVSVSAIHRKLARVLAGSRTSRTFSVRLAACSTSATHLPCECTKDETVEPQVGTAKRTARTGARPTPLLRFQLQNEFSRPICAGEVSLLQRALELDQRFSVPAGALQCDAVVIIHLGNSQLFGAALQ
jgi:hypothetical protein